MTRPTTSTTESFAASCLCVMCKKLLRLLTASSATPPSRWIPSIVAGHQQGRGSRILHTALGGHPGLILGKVITPEIIVSLADTDPCIAFLHSLQTIRTLRSTGILRLRPQWGGCVDFGKDCEHQHQARCWCCMHCSIAYRLPAHSERLGILALRLQQGEAVRSSKEACEHQHQARCWCCMHC